MKNLTIRAFVLALAVTGAAATTVSKASTPAKSVTTAFTEPGSPVPVCKPNSGNTCGID